MKKLYLLFSIAVLTLFSSCSKQLSYFTEDLYDDFRWNENELKEIQFYLSQDIHLQRHFDDEDSKIDEGRIRINSGRTIEEVSIKAGTPGLMLFSPRSDRFAISFDDNPDNYLMFGPHPKTNGRFVILAKKWSKNTGLVTYGNKEYQINNENAFASLMVDIEKAKNVRITKTTATGRTVKGD